MECTALCLRNMAKNEFIAWEGTVKLVEERTYQFTELLKDVIESMQHCETSADADWVREQGEELLEMAGDQMEAVHQLEKGARSLTQRCRSLMTDLQETKGKLEGLEFAGEQMSLQISSLQAEKRMLEDVSVLSPRNRKAMLHYGEKRAQDTKDDLTPLEVQLEEAKGEISRLLDAAEKDEKERGEIEALTKSMQEEIAKAGKEMEKLRIDLGALQKQHEATVDSKTKTANASSAFHNEENTPNKQCKS